MPLEHIHNEIFLFGSRYLQVMTLSNGEILVMNGRSLKLVLESGTLEDAAPPTLANCVSETSEKQLK